MGKIAQTGSYSIEQANLRQLHSRIYNLLDRGSILQQDIQDSLYVVADASNVNQIYFSGERLATATDISNIPQITGVFDISGTEVKLKDEYNTFNLNDSSLNNAYYISFTNITDPSLNGLYAKNDILYWNGKILQEASGSAYDFWAINDTNDTIRTDPDGLNVIINGSLTANNSADLSGTINLNGTTTIIGQTTISDVSFNGTYQGQATINDWFVDRFNTPFSQANLFDGTSDITYTIPDGISLPITYRDHNAITTAATAKQSITADLFRADVIDASSGVYSTFYFTKDDNDFSIITDAAGGLINLGKKYLGGKVAMTAVKVVGGVVATVIVFKAVSAAITAFGGGDEMRADCADTGSAQYGRTCVNTDPQSELINTVASAKTDVWTFTLNPTSSHMAVIAPQLNESDFSSTNTLKGKSLWYDDLFDEDDIPICSYEMPYMRDHTYFYSVKLKDYGENDFASVAQYRQKETDGGATFPNAYRMFALANTDRLYKQSGQVYFSGLPLFREQDKELKIGSILFPSVSGELYIANSIGNYGKITYGDDLRLRINDNLIGISGDVISAFDICFNTGVATTISAINNAINLNAPVYSVRQIFNNTNAAYLIQDTSGTNTGYLQQLSPSGSTDGAKIDFIVDTTAGYNSSQLTFRVDGVANDVKSYVPLRICGTAEGGVNTNPYLYFGGTASYPTTTRALWYDTSSSELKFDDKAVLLEGENVLNQSACYSSGIKQRPTYNRIFLDGSLNECSFSAPVIRGQSSGSTYTTFWGFENLSTGNVPPYILQTLSSGIDYNAGNHRFAGGDIEIADEFALKWVGTNPPSSTTNKLYAVGSTLYWDGNNISADYQSQINDLSSVVQDLSAEFYDLSGVVYDLSAQINDPTGLTFYDNMKILNDATSNDYGLYLNATANLSTTGEVFNIRNIDNNVLGTTYLGFYQLAGTTPTRLQTNTNLWITNGDLNVLESLANDWGLYVDTNENFNDTSGGLVCSLGTTIDGTKENYIQFYHEGTDTSGGVYIPQELIVDKSLRIFTDPASNYQIKVSGLDIAQHYGNREIEWYLRSTTSTQVKSIEMISSVSTADLQLKLFGDMSWNTGSTYSVGNKSLSKYIEWDFTTGTNINDNNKITLNATNIDICGNIACKAISTANTILSSSNDVGTYQSSSTFIVCQTGANMRMKRNNIQEWYSGLGGFSNADDEWVIGGVGGSPYVFESGGTASAVSWTSTSDRRIKKDFELIKDDESLKMVRAIEPTKYKYIDEINRGNEIVYGFIAQEVAEHFRPAVNIKRNAIPNVMKECSIDSNIIIFSTDTDVSLGDVRINNLKYFDYAQKPIKVISKIDNRIYKIDQQLTDTKGFVYGNYVDDFHYLCKEKLLPILWSGVQEMDRQMTAQKNELTRVKEINAELVVENANLKSRLDRIEKLLISNNIK